MVQISDCRLKRHFKDKCQKRERQYKEQINYEVN